MKGPIPDPASIPLPEGVAAVNVPNMNGGAPPAAAVPGPLPLLGAGAAFGFSRRLRRRVALRSASKPKV